MDEALSLSSYLVFNTVARSGNLSSAARELLISQPAVSRSLQKLEDSLSVKLFVRNSRGVRLTDEGALLYEHTRPAFDSLAQAERALKAHSSSGVENIKLGISTNLCKLLFTPRLKDIIKEYPLLKLDLRLCSSSEILEAVESGELDLGLITRLPSVHRLEYKELASFNDIFVASPSFIKSQKEHGADMSGPSLIENTRLLLPTKGSGTGALIRSCFSHSGLTPNLVTETDSIDSSLDFALSGLGVAIVPDVFAKEHIKKGALVKLEAPISFSGHSAGLIYERTSSQRESVMSLVHTLIKEDSV